jgi:hypothetical protein
VRGLAHKIEDKLEGPWSAEETSIVKQYLEDLPEELTLRNPNLKRIERQKVLKPKPPGAPGDSKFDTGRGAVVVYDQGVYDGGQKVKREHLARSVLHELAHSLDDELPKVFEEWKAISGWTQKGDKWLATNPRVGFVDDYAKTSPFEDWAETFQEHQLHPELVRKRVPEKARFVDRFLSAVRRGEIKLKEKI